MSNFEYSKTSQKMLGTASQDIVFKINKRDGTDLSIYDLCVGAAKRTKDLKDSTNAQIAEELEPLKSLDSKSEVYKKQKRKIYEKHTKNWNPLSQAIYEIDKGDVKIKKNENNF